MNYRKIKELIITLVIPLIIAIILGVLEVYGKKYVTPVTLVGVGILILFSLLYFAIRFLEGREKRWKGNKKIHTSLKERVTKLEEITKEIEQKQRTNEKLNILDKRISYIEGRIKK